MTARAVQFGLVTLLMMAIIGLGQEQPLPKPVTPPLPIPGKTPPNVPPVHAPPPARGEPDLQSPDSSAISPYLDNQTLAVARFDLRNVDFKALQDWVIQAADDLRKTHKEIFRARLNIHEELDKAFKWVEEFRAAGANQMYAVVSLDDITANRPPFLVIPLEKGTDSKAIVNLLEAGNEPAANAPASGPGGPMKATVVGDAVIFGDGPTIEHLKNMQHTARPEMSRAFAAAGKGQIHVALIPPQAAREMVASVAANLPEELGGGSMRPITHGIQWASLAVNLPPGPELGLVIQASDAQAAQQLKEIADKAIAWAGARKSGPVDELVFTQFLATLKPRLAPESRIEVRLNESQTRDFAGVFGAGLLNARNSAMRVQAMSNMRQIDLAIMEYGSDHGNALPKDLGREINKYLGPNAKAVWDDPLRPNQQKPYVYIRLADKLPLIQRPAESIIMYENHTTWDDGINAAFADGHVEWIAREQDFKQMLAQTKKRNPGAVEMPQ
jgi:prepilin-type processing-associated H-X9-DG protein